MLQIHCLLRFDANSILEVTAFEQKSKKACVITISDDNNLPAKKIQKMTEKVKNYHRDDEDNLNSSKCGICNQYLSYFPVFINSDKVSFCGRCSKEIPDGSIHNTSYESLAEKIKFPCVYHTKGCLQNLHPAEVPLHEKNCPFRETSCDLCCWKGPAVDLLKHFEELHPTAVRRNPEFEVDFPHSYQISELFIDKDELFIFKRNYFQSRRIFECLVSSHKTRNPNVVYSYQVQLNDVSVDNLFSLSSLSSLSMTCPPTVEGNITVISQDQINNDLDNPAAILGTVKILKPDEPPQSPNKRKRINPEVNYDLLTELECPVCFNYIVPPIFQCSAGHSICEECEEKIHLMCPICKKAIQNVHNITLEKMTQRLTYPCRFTENGCNYASKPSNIKQHQKNCVHGPLTCPLQDYEGCDYKTPINTLLDHLMNAHRNSFLESNTIEVPVNGQYYNKKHYMCYVIKFKGLLFKLQYLYKMSVFYWAVQLIGLPEDAKKYQYEIDVCDNSGNNGRMIFRSTCSPLANKKSSFDQLEKFVFINLDQISSFITDTLSYRIRVIP